MKSFCKHITFLVIFLFLASCTNDSNNGDKKVTSVTVTPSSASVQKGGSTSLQVDVKGENLEAADQNVTWKSDDTSIANVDQNGVVTGVDTGSTIITATSTFDSSKSGTTTMVVNDSNQAGLTEAQAERLAPKLLDNVSFITKSLGEPSSFLSAFSGLGLLELQQDDKCINIAKEGDTTTAEFNCKITLGKLNFSLVGIVVTEKLLGGYRTFTRPNLRWTASNDSENVDLTFDFDIKFTQLGNTYKLDVDYKLTSAGDEAFTSSYILKNATFVSSSTNDPLGNGTLTFDGTLSYQDGTESFTLKAKTDPNLVISSSCKETPIDGAVIYSLGKNSLRIVFNGCDNYNATFNGRKIAMTAH